MSTLPGAVSHMALLYRVILGLFLSAFLVGGAPNANAQQGHYIVFEAPGADLTPGNFDGTYPAAINNFGAITGSYQTVDTVYHGFVRSALGKTITFDAPGADMTAGAANGTFVSAINDLGAVTGYILDANGTAHGFIRSPDGRMTSFDVPGQGGEGVIPIAINLEGGIVGYYTDTNVVFRGFLRHPDGSFATFAGPNACDASGADGCFGTGLSNINSLGLSAGGFEDNDGNFVHHGLLRSPDGKLKVFNDPSAGTGLYQGTGCPGCAMGLNQLGFVAGIYSDSNSVNHGFVRSPDGRFTTFDAPGAGTDAGEGTGCFSDCNTYINDVGSVVGTFIDSNFIYHGYLRAPNGRIVTVDPSNSTSTFVAGINDFGVVTGSYIDANNVYHGFIRLPF